MEYAALDEEITDVEQAVDLVYRINGGKRPTTLSEWIHIVGRKGLRVQSRDIGADFQGCMSGNDIIVPSGIDEAACVRVVVHEFAHHILREIQHNQARRIERILLEDSSNG